jgi:signal transduction histidine kinase
MSWRIGETELSTTALYWIVAESLTNVVKHAHARHVGILLARENDNMGAVIEDDGHGFDANGARAGFGLQGMSERVILLGGPVRVELGAGSGTSLGVEVTLG